MLKQVTLYGELAQNYGRNWSLDVNSPSEAMQALAANNPGFRQFVCASHERGVGYKVMVGKTYLEKDVEIYDPSGRQEIKIVPVVLGAKKDGGGMIILGLMLMWAAPWMSTQILAAGQVAGPMSYLATTNTMAGIASAVSGAAMHLGKNLVLSGVASLLAPTPEPTPDEKQNYAFNGVVNTTRQGVAIPICYGQLMVGGAVISAGMIAEDY